MEQFSFTIRAPLIMAGLLFFLRPLENAFADFPPTSAMLRSPDISGEHVAFLYAGNIWVAPRHGPSKGEAYPLTTSPGAESGPRFNTDGTLIAYAANYDGNREIYVIPVAGGIPQRVTWHPDSETLWDWTEDGRLLFSMSGFAGIGRQSQLFTVTPAGELPQRVPVPYGTEAAISPDGRMLAYTPMGSAGRTWKRYQGGAASDIWLFDLVDRTARKITEWPGDDGLPMWLGTRVHYLSSQSESNKTVIWSYDSLTSDRRQITHNTDWDIKYPSIGPGANGQGEIIYQFGPALHVLDLSTGESVPFTVTVRGDRPNIRTKLRNAADNLTAIAPSPTAKRVVVEARGDIWTVPSEVGSPRNLTRSSGVAERDPAWSPDGRWIACFSDASGEYQVTLLPAAPDSADSPVQLTTTNDRFLSNPIWSPDSKRLAWSDNSGTMWVATAGSEGWGRGETPALVDTDTWGELMEAAFSPDSRLLAYTKQGTNHLAAVWLFNVDTGERTRLTAGRFHDASPAFSPNGDWLALTSQRDFSSPIYENIHGLDFVYDATEAIYIVPLRTDVKNPFAPKSDEEALEVASNKEEKIADEKRGEDKKEDGRSGAGEVPDTAIDATGFESRLIRVPVSSGRYGSVAFSHENKLLYTRTSTRGEWTLYLFDPTDEKREEKSVLTGVSGFQMTADGKKTLVQQGERRAYIDPAPDQKTEKAISLGDLPVDVNPREEWNQIFTDAWRIVRQYFYDPGIHGLDWSEVRTRYSAMLADCVSREDLGYILGEMIGELNTSHAYVGSLGDIEAAPSRNIGMLGCDFSVENGAVRISRIIRGADWDADAIGPLSELGVDAKEGDYLLAVNGVPVDMRRSPYAAFESLAGLPTRLTLSANPTIDEGAREVLVRPLGSEAGLRYREWIERNRAYVEARTNGRVGYIHVPNTGINGQNELHRQYFGQVDLPGMIVDERWNGGGQTSDRFIDLLHRPILNYRVRRYGLDIAWPPDAHQGPKCMLINGAAGSGGDLFPYYFRKRGVGKLIGMRTWGGIVGLTGNPGFIDGGSITVPTRAFFETDGTWGIEGRGVGPDIEVIDDPALMASDNPYEVRDPQLDAAITQIMLELETNPYVPTRRPAYPDRSGAGLPEDEH